MEFQRFLITAPSNHYWARTYCLIHTNTKIVTWRHRRSHLLVSVIVDMIINHCLKWNFHIIFRTVFHSKNQVPFFGYILRPTYSEMWQRTAVSQATSKSRLSRTLVKEKRKWQRKWPIITFTFIIFIHKINNLI